MTRRVAGIDIEFCHLYCRSSKMLRIQNIVWSDASL